jgi:hypothetical protein
MERVVQRKFLKIVTLTVATAVLAHAQDGEPDIKREERFHRIYKKYNEQPTSEEAWEKVLSGRKANSYSVQNKDTLWDISHTLFGDSSYWPKVWSYNTDDIQNPHEINPSQQIRFYPGTMAEAPTVGLADKNAPAEEMPSHVLEKNEAGKLESIKIPPPKKKSRPVVKKLPESLPLYRLGAVNKPPVDFEVSGARVVHPPAPKYLSFYIADNPVDSVGEIVEMEQPDERTSNENELVIVRVSNAANKRFIVVKDDVKISDPSEVLGNKAYVVEVQGEVELRERVNEGENLFRAVVKKAIQPLDTGAKLIPGTVQTFDTTPTPVTTAVQSKIIGGEYQRYDQRVFGTDNFVFLNAGAKEGLQDGSTLNIFLNERIRKSNTGAVSNDRVIGQVKIIKLADHFATGYVLDSTNEIEIGDYAGGSVKPAPSQSSAGSGSGDLDSGTVEAPPTNGGGGGSSSGGSDSDFDLDTPGNGSGGDSGPAPTDDFQL